MTINLKNRHSPCAACFLRTGTAFDPKLERCINCEYNIIWQLLTNILKEEDDRCALCKHKRYLDNGKWDCPTVTDKNFVCNNGEHFELNLEAAYKSIS